MKLDLWLIFLCLVTSSVTSGRVLAQQNEPSTIAGYDKIVSRHGSFEAFLKTGAEAAERFRQSFVIRTELESKAETVGRLILQFSQQQFEDHSEKPNQKQLEIVDLHDKFQGHLVANGSGYERAKEIYGPFEGKWYGRWTDFDVDHHWSRVVKCKRELPFDGNESESDFFVEAYQYAWIGDGYGVNIFAREDFGPKDHNQESRYHLLGYVEHIKDGSFDKITARRPHVGIAGRKKGSLFWITGSEVFFEQANQQSDEAKQYSIFGFHYSMNPKSAIAKQGFFTRYSKSTNRTPYQKLKVNLQVSRSHKPNR